MRKTARSRFIRAVRTISLWLRANRHLPVADQYAKLSQKLRGHDAYDGITGNARALNVFRYWTTRLWHKWLNRRSQRLSLSWESFNALLAAFPLPAARVVHSVYRRTAKP